VPPPTPTTVLVMASPVPTTVPPPTPTAVPVVPAPVSAPVPSPETKEQEREQERKEFIAKVIDATGKGNQEVWSQVVWMSPTSGKWVVDLNSSMKSSLAGREKRTSQALDDIRRKIKDSKGATAYFGELNINKEGKQYKKR
jgi:hypothetical protein